MGERRAVWFYRWRGWAVVATNLRAPGGEIDLVVRRGRQAAFVEVKTRQTRGAGEPHEAVDWRKQQRMFRAADRLVRALRIEGLQMRYDILSLYWNGWSFEVEHFPDAVECNPLDGWGRSGFE
jgi:putative endonuclease